MDYIKYCILRLLHGIWITFKTVYSDYYMEYGLHSILYTQTITWNTDYIQYCILRLLHGIWITLKTVYSDYYMEYGLHSILYTQTITWNTDYIQYCILRLLHGIWITLKTVYSDYYTEYGLHSILNTPIITQNMDYIKYCFRLLQQEKSLMCISQLILHTCNCPVTSWAIISSSRDGSCPLVAIIPWTASGSFKRAYILCK